MNRVKPKKRLGQHFLTDRGVARRIADSFQAAGCDSVLEIGPGMGILTGYLLERNFSDFRVIEIDEESVAWLRVNMPGITNIITGDFLRTDLGSLFGGTLGITGNFPYNISSQILFRVLENREKVLEITGMFQKEVAERICAPPGSKTYGILSVLVQAWYRAEFLFSVSPGVFTPPPKVKSGVIRITREPERKPGCDEDLFFRVVKAAFNQRRKTLRNSIRASFRLQREDFPLFHLRPEQLSVQQFADLTNWLSENRASG